MPDTMTTTTGTVAWRGPDLDRKPHASVGIIFIALLIAGLGYTVQGLMSDISSAGGPPLATGAFLLLGVALLIALAFEFVNGFHDPANAVATVIYVLSSGVAGTMAATGPSCNGARCAASPWPGC